MGATLPLEIAGRVHRIPVDWYRPPGGPAPAVVWLQHGFSRRGHHLADLARLLAADGLLVLTPTLPAAGPAWINGPATHEAIARTLGSVEGRDALAVSCGEPLPERLVLAGHSAGGNAVTGVGGRLAGRSDASQAWLAGLLLLDPVEHRGTMAAALPALVAAGVPVLAVTARPAPCNARGSGERVLLAGGRGFVGARLPEASHCTPEAATTTVPCGMACGPTRLVDVAALTHLTRTWAASLAGLSSGPAPQAAGGEHLADSLNHPAVAPARPVALHAGYGR